MVWYSIPCANCIADTGDGVNSSWIFPLKHKMEAASVWQNKNKVGEGVLSSVCVCGGGSNTRLIFAVPQRNIRFSKWKQLHTYLLPSPFRSWCSRDNNLSTECSETPHCSVTPTLINTFNEKGAKLGNTLSEAFDYAHLGATHTHTHTHTDTPVLVYLPPECSDHQRRIWYCSGSHLVYHNKHS